MLMSKNHTHRSILVSLSLLLAACGSDVTNSNSASASSTGSGGAGGHGGEGGNGGAGGNGGNGGTGGSMGNAVYSASNLFTHVPRFVIFKADPKRDVCFRIWVEGIGGTGIPGMDVTMPWVASKAEVTNHAIDCQLQNGYPMQPVDSADATSGTGTITIQGNFPCEVTLHGTLSFTLDAAKPWIPATEPLDVDNLPVDGGCG